MHGVKKPVTLNNHQMQMDGVEEGKTNCEYQNYFLKARQGLDFWIDKQMNKDGIFADDNYMQV